MTTTANVKELAESLDKLSEIAYANAHSKGFWHREPGHTLQDETCLPEKIALMHSELSEALEHYRDGLNPRYLYYRNEADELVPGHEATASEREGKPDGIAVELADVLIRIFDLAGRFDIPLGEALTRKMQHNAGRPFMHGGKRA